MTEAAEKRLRCFIAIPLPKKLQQQICRLQQDIRQAVPQLKPVPANNLHLTLHFLGEQTQDQLAKITSAMLSIAQNKNIFNVTVAGPDCFPDQQQAKILYLGFAPSTELAEIHQLLATALTALNMAPDPRPWRPHITIGRFNRARRLPGGLCPFMSQQYDKLTVNKMILFQSQLTGSGAIHTPLTTADLAGTEN